MSARIAGVLVRVDRELHFLPATVATRLVRRPVVTNVPGSALGMTLVDGHVIPVVDVTPAASDLLLCDVEGDVVALSGVEVVDAGAFDADGDGVEHDGRRVTRFDVLAAVRAVAARPGSAA